MSKEATLTTGPPVVPGTALAALVSLRSAKTFAAARQADFTAALRRALAGGDVAQLRHRRRGAGQSRAGPYPQPEDQAALRQAQSKLTLPREIEAWLGLQQALDKLTKRAQTHACARGPRQPAPH
ncbi:MAG: hypothetical protein WKG07_07675 [Hymenobacter sp.]